MYLPITWRGKRVKKLQDPTMCKKMYLFHLNPFMSCVYCSRGKWSKNKETWYTIVLFTLTNLWITMEISFSSVIFFPSTKSVCHWKCHLNKSFMHAWLICLYILTLNKTVKGHQSDTHGSGGELIILSWPYLPPTPTAQDREWSDVWHNSALQPLSQHSELPSSSVNSLTV